MKPVNRNLADEFHEDSQEGIDAVFGRMEQVVGRSWGGYNEIFDVSPNTIKTWRRRGAVSTKFLQGFAEKYGTTIDYLIYGERKGIDAPLVLSELERDLVCRYRAAPAALRDAALRVLLGGTESTQEKGGKYAGSSIGQVVTGDYKAKEKTTFNVGTKGTKK